MVHLRKRSSFMPQGPAAKRITPKTWGDFLHAIANGTLKHVALKTFGWTDQTFQAYLISKPGISDQYRDAKLSWIRRDWPLELIEDLMRDIAKGMLVKDACRLREVDQDTLYRIVFSDPVVSEMFATARKISMEIKVDEILEIADKIPKDIETHGGNAQFNSALVNASKAQISTRQWIMAKLHFQQYGDHSKQTVESRVTVDHVQTLEDARKRKEIAAKKNRKILRQAKKRRQEQNDPLTLH